MPSNPVFQSDEPDLRDNDYNRHPRSRTLDADFRNVQDEISGRLKRKENAVEMDIVPGQRRRASFVGNFPNLTVKVEKDDGSVDPWSLPELRPDGSPWKGRIHNDHLFDSCQWKFATYRIFIRARY